MLPSWLKRQQRTFQVWAHQNREGCACSYSIPMWKGFNPPTQQELEEHLSQHVPGTTLIGHWAERLEGGGHGVHPHSQFIWTGTELVIR